MAAKGLFIIGTGTDIGKTYITGLICKKLKELPWQPRVAYFKAAMSGNERRSTTCSQTTTGQAISGLASTDQPLIPGDALTVQRMAGLTQPLTDMCPYVYEAAYSPHLAAQVEGPLPQLDVIAKAHQKLCSTYDYITAEGSGGIICPLRYDPETDRIIMLTDVIRLTGHPSLLIADAGLGTLNAVALTTAYMAANSLPLVGIILDRYDPTDPIHRDNVTMLPRLTGLPVLCCVQNNATDLDLSPTALASLYR